MTIPTPAEFWRFNNTLVGINGNTLVSPDGLEHFVTGKVGQAWDVANLANRVLVQSPGAINPGSTSWTASWWVYVTNPDAIDLSYHWSLSDNTLLLGGHASLGLSALSIRLGVSLFSLQMAEDPETGDPLSRVTAGWNHLAATFSADAEGVGFHTLRGWLNGVQDNGSQIGIADYIPALTSPIFRLGGTTGAAYGEPIDSWGWWDAVLTNEQISELYNSGLGWEPTTYATLTINDGPLAGQYIVLKTG